MTAGSNESRGAILTLGFATSVAMWSVAYLCRLPVLTQAGLTPGWLLLALFLLCLVAGGACGGRWAGGVMAGVAVGATASAVNLLILGSVLGDSLKGKSAGDAGLTALAWVAGSVGAGVILGGMGALMARVSRGEARPPDWSSAFSRVAAVATLLLLAVGGLVTSKEAGLAVPDWPTTYSANMFLYPLSRMTGGVYYEHTHRLFGALVGMTTFALTVQVWRTEQRAWIRRLAGCLFLLVCLQGLMGGYRVEEAARWGSLLRVVHGVTAQVFFALLVGLSAFLSATWKSDRGRSRSVAAATTIPLATWMVALVLLQIVLGAIVRHLHGTVTWHITVGVFVLLLAGAGGLRAWGTHSEEPALPKVGLALVILVTVQFLLGIGALATTGLEHQGGPLAAYQVPVTTVHQTVGALVLACAVLLRLWVHRFLEAEQE